MLRCQTAAPPEDTRRQPCQAKRTGAGLRRFGNCLVDRSWQPQLWISVVGPGHGRISFHQAICRVDSRIDVIRFRVVDAANWIRPTSPCHGSMTRYTTPLKLRCGPASPQRKRLSKNIPSRSRGVDERDGAGRSGWCQADDGLSITIAGNAGDIKVEGVHARSRQRFQSEDEVGIDTFTPVVPGDYSVGRSCWGESQT